MPVHFAVLFYTFRAEIDSTAPTRLYIVGNHLFPVVRNNSSALW
jgi:hypothetical protein